MQGLRRTIEGGARRWRRYRSKGVGDARDFRTEGLGKKEVSGDGEYAAVKEYD